MKTELFSGYAPDKPLGGYAALLALFSALGAGFAARFGERDLPGCIDPGDLALLGVATHKLSRLLTMDKVTAPLRAPFTRYLESAGAGEVSEEARGEGLQRAVGELATCPYCASPWVAGGVLAAWVVRPRLTRLACAMLACIAAAHFLHHTYAMVKNAQRRQEEQAPGERRPV